MRLGRYPFKAGIKHYVERKKGTWDDETTAPQREGALNHIGDILEEMASESGVDFSLKMFRSTLCTLTVNADLSRLPAMAVQLRHADPSTTTEYYAAIDRSNAGRQLADAWRETSLKPQNEPNHLAPLVSKHPSIDSKFEVTGYV